MFNELGQDHLKRFSMKGIFRWHDVDMKGKYSGKKGSGKLPAANSRDIESLERSGVLNKKKKVVVN